MKTLNECITFRQELIDRLRVTMPEIQEHDLAWILKCSIVFNPRMRTTAGRAKYLANEIELNATLLTKHPEEFDDTFVHELAHLIAVKHYGIKGKGHNRYWQHVMRSLGYKPTRTHNLDVSDVKRRHAVICLAKCNRRTDIKIKPVRYKRILNGTKYRCRACSSYLSIDLSKNVTSV